MGNIACTFVTKEYKDENTVAFLKRSPNPLFNTM